VERKIVWLGLDSLTHSVKTLGMSQTLQAHAAAEVRAELARQRKTQSALAEALGRSEAYVTRRLTGEVAFNLEEIESVAGFLGVPTSRFLERAACTR
jgi:cyanate lyase